jgi:hypothetical protein
VEPRFDPDLGTRAEEFELEQHLDSSHIWEHFYNQMKCNKMAP